MQLLVLTTAFLSLSVAAFAQIGQTFNTTLTYNPLFDNLNVSTTGIACSNGANGVICNDCALTLGGIPHWPNIAGAPVVAGWNSTQCRTCWSLTLIAPGEDFDNTTLAVRVVDASADGFTVGVNLMDAVTNGQARRLGRVDAVATRVLEAACEPGQQNQPVQACSPPPPPNFGCP